MYFWTKSLFLKIWQDWHVDEMYRPSAQQIKPLSFLTGTPWSWLGSVPGPVWGKTLWYCLGYPLVLSGRHSLVLSKRYPLALFDVPPDSYNVYFVYWSTESQKMYILLSSHVLTTFCMVIQLTTILHGNYSDLALICQMSQSPWRSTDLCIHLKPLSPEKFQN